MAFLRSNTRYRSQLRDRSLGLLLLVVLIVTTSCSSMSFTRESETHGKFYANGISITLLSIDLPRAALDIARENLSDARQPNMRIEEETVFPYLGWFDWIFDIVGIRYGSISGTWGFPPDGEPDVFAN